MKFVCENCGYEIDYDGYSNDALGCLVCKRGIMLIKNNKSLGLKCKNCGKVFTYYSGEAACMMKIREYNYKLSIIRKCKRQDDKRQDELVMHDADVHCCENPHLEYCYWK